MVRHAELIDLSELDDDDPMFDMDEDIVELATPPPNMRKRNNAERPIDVDEEGGGEALQRFTPEENEGRRMLMMDHDVMVEERPKRKVEEEIQQGSKRTRSGGRRPAEPVASGSRVAGVVPENVDTPEKNATPAKRVRLDGKSGEGSTRQTPQNDGSNPPAETPNQTPATSSLTPETPTLDSLVSQLLAIIPDMCPEHASKELSFLFGTRQTANAIETVLTKAFEDGYPRQKKETTILEVGGDEKYAGRIYRMEKRKGPCYQALSNAALEEAFPFVPVPYIRQIQTREAFLFGPTYIQLVTDDLNPVKPFTILKRPRPASKGKGAMPEMDQGGVEFELEKNWVLAHVAAMRVRRDAAIAKKLADEAEWAAGGGVECGCCFDECLPGDMYQCRDGHLFCKDCCIRHTETKLGDEVFIILCMDTSGCGSRFDEKELARALPAKSMELLQRLRFAQELEDAAIKGLETCPSCPWAVVIDNPDEKLFRCQNDACGKVSCRQCRKVEHLPKSCEEFAAFLKQDKRHAVEDAMSEALIRKCPKCQKPYIKDSGCNKIICTKCKAKSCYICQKIIEGYHHFIDHQPPGTATAANPGCRLYDYDEANKDAANVIRARDAAVLAQTERAAREGVAIDVADLAIEAPVAAPRLPGLGLPYPGYVPRLYPRGPAYDPAHMEAVYGRPPGLDAIRANANRPPAQPGPFLPNGQPQFAYFPIPPPGAYGPQLEAVHPMMLEGREERAAYDDYREEARRFGELREQRRILEGPPPVRAERAVRAANRAAGRMERMEERMAAIRAERIGIQEELAVLVERGRELDGQRQVRFADQEQG